VVIEALESSVEDDLRAFKEMCMATSANTTDVGGGRRLLLQPRGVPPQQQQQQQQQQQWQSARQLQEED
jgi:hypothetical protein